MTLIDKVVIETAAEAVSYEQPPTE